MGDEEPTAIEHDTGVWQIEALELVVIGQVGDRLVVVGVTGSDSSYKE